MIIQAIRKVETGKIETKIQLTDGANFEQSKAELVAAIISFSRLMEQQAQLADINLRSEDIIRLIKTEIDFRTAPPSKLLN